MMFGRRCVARSANFKWNYRGFAKILSCYSYQLIRALRSVKGWKFWNRWFRYRKVSQSSGTEVFCGLILADVAAFHFLLTLSKMWNICAQSVSALLESKKWSEASACACNCDQWIQFCGVDACFCSRTDLLKMSIPNSNVKENWVDLPNPSVLSLRRRSLRLSAIFCLTALCSLHT